MLFCEKIRQINRKRNYFIKKLKYNANLYLAAKRWNYHCKEFPLDKTRTILLLRNDGKIGDAIISTCMLKTLCDAGYKIDILANEENSFIFSNNPYVRNLYLTNTGSIKHQSKFESHIPENILYILKENAYDLLIDTGVWDTALYMPKLISEIKPKQTLGFNKPTWLKQYTTNINFNYHDKHITGIYRHIIEKLNITIERHLEYDVYYPQSILDDMRTSSFFVNQQKNILINPYASHDDRSLSETQISEIIKGLSSTGDNIIVLDYKKSLTKSDYPHAKLLYTPTLYHVMAAVFLSDLVITPDTSLVHISAMYNKKLIGIYRDVSKNNLLWGPGYKNGHQIFSAHHRLYQDMSVIKKVIELKKALI
ncbi:glycosyltransferase family 9 protein [Serratia symbiotica]|uniref:Glycosyltransferase family 9 protein n=1 Tax=Serratia symbiotica TaxID=138074 RepID=A0A068Z6I6_9GAMM|nr:glycosyltransferase family 9 protein [Serratia symbiotica]QLH62318.1 glycosyltransferase family 9 protein [Serratia symbiotica]CDS57849.1 ADP-heptose:LPS heptosyltransferase [Serratia symbiotica]